jgi:hypothetical protein
MNIYSILDLFFKFWKKVIKEIEEKNSSFGILKTKKNGKGGKQNKYLRNTY